MATYVRFALVACLAIAMGACREADEITGEETHTPVMARLYANGEELTPNVSLTRGQTLRIEVRFFAAGGDYISGIEADHFAKLTFNAATLASATDVPDLRFFKYVVSQASAGTTGTVSVGYGHRAAADEHRFGPFQVTIR